MYDENLWDEVQNSRIPSMLQKQTNFTFNVFEYKICPLEF
jgi:hypothetical protein